MIRTLLLFSVPLLACGQVQVDVQARRTEAVTSDIRRIIVSRQAEIKPALGETATLCYTDVDYKKFQDEKRAPAIAREVSQSKEFAAALGALSKLDQQSRHDVLAVLGGTRQRTVAENGGRFGPDSQTDAGIKAQKDIAVEILNAFERRLR